jgi:hypothetical protein
MHRIALILFMLSLAVSFPAMAGPPFLTDDPEPVEYKHWEVYVASISLEEHGGVSITAPHIEINYGAAPNLQLHLIAPLEYVKTSGLPHHYGYGDTELGFKWRFYNDEESKFMVGIFPLLELPTGAESKGLGLGGTQVFVPLWLQKGWGPWLTYGGGGYLNNPGPGRQNLWFFGWLLQRDLNEHLTIGAELFDGSPPDTGDERHFGFNIGSIINITEKHHILVSAGADLIGPAAFYSYLAYQLTFGPEKEKSPGEAHVHLMDPVYGMSAGRGR